MPAFQIPSKEKKFIQPNKSDTFGNLFSTFNLDFDSALGKVRVAPRVRINTDSGDDADLGLPLAFVRSSAGGTDQWWALTAGTGSTGALFKSSSNDPTGAFTQDALAGGDGTPTDMTRVSSDMVEFEGALIVSSPTDLHRLSASDWDKGWWDTTLAQTALTTGIAHPLHVTKKTNYLLIGDGNLLHTIDKNNNVRASRVILPTEFEIICIRSTYDGTWIGARSKFNREAQAFFWDESAENYNRTYSLKSDMVFSCVIWNGIPYFVNGEGQLLGFNGSGFEEVAVFPNFEQINKRLEDGSTVRRSIHRNGMDIIEGKIHILINSSINNDFSKFLENFPFGIWTYDKDGGLRHKYAISQYDGTEIDYGSFVPSATSALVATDSNLGLFLAGGIITTNATTTLNAIFYRDINDSINKRGHFVTTIFESVAFEDIFKDLLATFKRFENSGDKIIIKYRSIKDPAYPIKSITGTFTDTNTFTSTDSSLSAAVVGDELFITRGRGAGTGVHISAIAFSTPTYTIDLDEAITNASGTFRADIDNWTKCATISTQGIDRQGFDLDVPGTFIKLKVELRSAPAGTAANGSSPELERIVVNTTNEEVI